MNYSCYHSSSYISIMCAYRTFSNAIYSILASPSLTKVLNFAACVNDYFQEAEIEFTMLKLSSKDTIHKYYRAVLDSKSNDENVVCYVVLLSSCIQWVNCDCSDSNDNDAEMIRHYLGAGSQDILGTVTGIPGNNM